MTKEKKKEYMKKYRQTDIYKKNYEEKYKPKIREYNREHKEEKQKYYKENKEKMFELRKKWKQTPNGKQSINKWRIGYRERTGCNLYEPKPYTEEENQMILEHSIPDRDLAEKLERSVVAIQHQRYRLKKTAELGEGWERR